MRLHVLLAAAAVTAVVLTAVGAVVHVATDPVVRDCAAANTAVETANDTNQDAMRELDRAELRATSRTTPEDPAPARWRAQQTQAELDAARAAFQLACHYQTDNPPSPTPRE